MQRRKKTTLLTTLFICINSRLVLSWWNIYKQGFLFFMCHWSILPPTVLPALVMCRFWQHKKMKTERIHSQMVVRLDLAEDRVFCPSAASDQERGALAVALTWQGVDAKIPHRACTDIFFFCQLNGRECIWSSIPCAALWGRARRFQVESVQS